MARTKKLSHVAALDMIEKLVQDPEVLGLVKGLRTHAIYSDDIKAEIGKIVRATDKSAELKEQLTEQKDLIKQSRAKIEELWRASNEEQDIVTLAARESTYTSAVQNLQAAREKVDNDKKTTATERMDAQVHSILFDATPPTITAANSEAYTQAKAFLDTHDTANSGRFPDNRSRHVLASLTDFGEGFPAPGSATAPKKGRGSKEKEPASDGAEIVPLSSEGRRRPSRPSASPPAQ